MKRIVLGLLTLLTISEAFTQKLYFIYLQSEPEQGFFIRMNEKTHSSSTSGYLILSRLRDTSYNFSVGFPQNKWPEQKFTVDVKAKDHGYLLRDFGEKGWGLFDMETRAVQMSLSDNSGSKIKTESKEVSVFTDVLSKAANDPSLKEKPIPPPSVVGKEDTKPAMEQTIIRKEELPVVKKEEPAEIIKEQPITGTEEVKTIPVDEYKRSVVTKRSESSTSEGFSLTFVDDYGNGKKDTIRIIILNQKTNLADVKGVLKEERKFLDITTNDTAKERGPALKDIKSVKSPPVAKNECSFIASENDFLKLRRKMAAETGDDAMIGEAKKYFKTRCFEADQLKNLSYLFLNDAGKYKFFDAAFLHVSDKENFSSLETELKDEYYINRFKAMLR